MNGLSHHLLNDVGWTLNDTITLIGISKNINQFSKNFQKPKTKYRGNISILAKHK